jgi:hypothetical protein
MYPLPGFLEVSPGEVCFGGLHGIVDLFFVGESTERTVFRQLTQ